MAIGQLQADTAFVVHLRSYGFFHSGRERLRVQVLKRTWEHIPGSTLYGALAAALIRLDGVVDAEIAQEAQAFTEGERDYYRLLHAVKDRRLRFTPLLPAPPGHPLHTGQAYCTQAMCLHTAVYADAEAETGCHEESLLHTTPHAPLNRATEQIHADQLFAIRTHRPLLDYYGFVFASEDLRPILERALRVLPFMPVGGRGKFSLVEGDIAHSQPLDDFQARLRAWAEAQERTGWVRLLTPVVLADGQPDVPLTGAGRDLVMTGLRRYRVWRTGRYYDAQHDTFGDPMGIKPGDGVDPDAFLAGGQESQSVRAVPERSRFRPLDGEDVATWFVEGLGNPSWTYLGWGQVVIE